MICLERDGELLLITQSDHAHLAGEVLRLWRHPELRRQPRYRDLLFAARRHDNGWQEADAAPRLHPAADRPHDFLSIPSPVRLEIWERGTARFADARPYAALLITEHALRLLAQVSVEEPEREGWQRGVARLESRRGELLERTGTDVRRLERDYRWLRLADLLSLVVCGGWPGPIEVPGLCGDWREPELLLDPFPLAGATRFEVPCRRLRRRRFRGAADLGTELAAAPWQAWPVRLVPASAGLAKRA